MCIWVVIAWDNYYPSPDNTKGYYMKEEDAKKHYEWLLTTKMYDFYDYRQVEVK